MKKIIITTLAVMAVFTGCKKDKVSESMGTGMLSLELLGDGNLSYGDVILKSEENIAELDVNTFSIVIDGLEGKYHNEWATYAEMPPVLELSSGKYTITATSPKSGDSKWGEPVYSGSSDFTISVGATSTVEVVCGISNVKVSINLTDAFLAEIVDFEITVEEQKENGKTLIWTNDDITAGQSAYFDVSPLQIYVTGKRWDDTPDNPSVANTTARISDVQAAKHYILNLNAITSGNGNVTLEIDPSLDDQTENIDIPGLIETPVEGGDDPADPDPEDPETPAISIEWPSNPNFDRTQIVEGMNVNLSIKAPAGISTFVVSVDSPALNNVIPTMTTDGSRNMDMINDTKLIPYMSEFGLPTGDALKGQTSVDFPLSGLLPFILGLPNNIGDHNFTLSVTDASGNSFSQTLTFYVE